MMTEIALYGAFFLGDLLRLQRHVFFFGQLPCKILLPSGYIVLLMTVGLIPFIVAPIAGTDQFHLGQSCKFCLNILQLETKPTVLFLHTLINRNRNPSFLWLVIKLWKMGRECRNKNMKLVLFPDRAESSLKLCEIY